jgi:hypothetical protein
MESLKGNTEPYELKSFNRKLDPEDHLKDRMIIRHLRRPESNFLFDFDVPEAELKISGAIHE